MYKHYLKAAKGGFFVFFFGCPHLTPLEIYKSIYPGSSNISNGVDREMEIVI